MAGGIELIADRHEGGDSGTVVLLHAGGESRAVYRPIAPTLTALGWDVVAPDFRGHGESGRSKEYRLTDLCSDTLAVIEQFAEGPLVLAGGSLGGVVALRVAASLGERLAGIGLLDIVPTPRADSGHRELEKIQRAQERGAPSVADLDPAMAAIVAEVLGARESTAAAARALSVPVVLIHGTRSHVIGDPELAAFAREIPHGRVIGVDAGHLVARDQPGPVAEALASLL